MAKKNEEVVKEVVEVTEDTVELQTTFNEDTFDVLCGEDTIVENIEDVKEDE